VLLGRREGASKGAGLPSFSTLGANRVAIGLSGTLAKATPLAAKTDCSATIGGNSDLIEAYCKSQY
jgi:hypothetical protein